MTTVPYRLIVLNPFFVGYTGICCVNVWTACYTHENVVTKRSLTLFFYLVSRDCALLQGARTVLEKLTVVQLVKESANIIHPESSVAFILQPSIFPYPKPREFIPQPLYIFL
jgi:hypothetical protein